MKIRFETTSNFLERVYERIYERVSKENKAARFNFGNFTLDVELLEEIWADAYVEESTIAAKRIVNTVTSFILSLREQEVPDAEN